MNFCLTKVFWISKVRWQTVSSWARSLISHCKIRSSARAKRRWQNCMELAWKIVTFSCVTISFVCSGSWTDCIPLRHQPFSLAPSLSSRILHFWRCIFTNTIHLASIYITSRARNISAFCHYHGISIWKFWFESNTFSISSKGLEWFILSRSWTCSVRF